MSSFYRFSAFWHFQWWPEGTFRWWHCTMLFRWFKISTVFYHWPQSIMCK